MLRTKLGAALATVLIGVVASTGVAQAELAFDPDSVRATFSSPQAGGHADFTTRFALTTDDIGQPTGSLGSLVMDLPRGFYANPTVTPKCSVEQVLSPTTALGECPMNTAVGVATVRLGDGFGTGGSYEIGPLFVYNVAPYRDQPAALMFSAIGVPIRIDASIRTDGDYNVQAQIQNVAEGQPLITSDVTLWGVPVDHQGPGPFTSLYGTSFGGKLPGAERKPFLTNPSVCDGNPLVTTFRTTAWLSNETPSYTAESPALTGCDKQVFSPSLAVAPVSDEAGAPSAYNVVIAIPQASSPDGVGTPPLRDATVTLPEGTAISPSSADGLGACSDAQLGAKSKAPEQCPDSSKIGAVTIDTPLLEEPLLGSVYLGTQQSRDPASGKMYRLFLVAAGSGVRLKLEGSVKADPVTGQLTTTFMNNPELPFNKLTVAFKGGNRAPLFNPPTCGPKTATAALTSWGGQSSTVTSQYTISQGCEKILRFDPSFNAGVSNPAANGSSSFVMNMGRPDGQQDLSGVDVTLPPGLVGNVGSVPLCAEALAAAGTCGVESRVGHTTVASGGGTQPLVVPQAGKAPTSVSLTGPYKGAPFGLSIVVPAQAGPFDLGTVVVRAALFIDRNDTHVTVNSDPLPTIVGGVPLRMQKVNVTLDRPRFMVNPTDCTPKRIGGQVRSAQGAAVNVGSRFQVGDCGSLSFKPRMTFKVGARGKTSNGKRTPFEARLWMTPGQANNRAIEVTLPKILNARLDVVDKRTACTIEQFNADRCPQIVGNAAAVTPLLRDPLKGSAFFVYNPARRLPDLVVRLKGQVNVDLVGKVTITKALELQTTFDTIPDVPISSFRLTLESGPRNGPIGITRNLCLASTRKALNADLAFTAQSNKRISRAQKISVAGCGKASRPAARRASKAKRAAARK